MNKMKKLKSQGQETQQMLRERFPALLFIELVSYPFFPEGSSIVGHKTTMSDKISWDTFRKKRFSIHKRLALFYLHLALSLWYPGPPIQCCVGVVICAVEEIEKKTHCFEGKGWGVGGGMFPILRDIRAWHRQFRVLVISTLFLTEKGMK